MTIEKIRNIHNVKIENGSGVLVKPLSNNYMYIFTCYHVIKNLEIKAIRCSFSPDSELANEVICIERVICNDKYDTAIIIIRNNIKVESFIPLYTLHKYEGLMTHIGFPSARYNGKAISPSNVLYIHSCDGSIKNNLVEYEYRKSPIKKEIEGMSGGGVFTKNFKLVGIHKQSSNLDNYELLGKAAYIPICKYKELIKNEELSPVVEFDLNRFASFVQIVFDLSDQKGVSDNVRKLMSTIDEYKYELYDMSPVELFDKLKELGRINPNACIDELDRKHWIHFTEFLIGIMILLDIHKKNDNFIMCIYDKFHYVYSKESFDVFEAREKLDLDLIKGMHGKSKLIIGGLSSNHYGGDILKPIDEVPTISQGLTVQDMDIAISQRHILDKMTIINCCIFRDTICDRCDDIHEVEDQLGKYKQLLIKKLC